MSSSLFNVLFLMGGVAATIYLIAQYIAPLPVGRYVQQYNPGEAARIAKGIQYATSYGESVEYE